MRRLLGALIAALVTAGALTACGGTATAGTCLSSFAPASSSSATTTAGRTLPKLSLACLDGSGNVALPTLSTPMIISFWAEYCAPCRTELPALATFATAAAGKVAVIGVDTADDENMARSMASGMGLAFPMLADPDSRLYRAVAAPGMPTLLFVTPGGGIAYSLSSNDVDGTTLRQLTTKYLDVTVG